MLDPLSEKDLLEKAAAIKIFKYSLLGKEFKKQTSKLVLQRKQYQKLNEAFKSNKKKETKLKQKKLC